MKSVIIAAGVIGAVAGASLIGTGWFDRLPTALAQSAGGGQLTTAAGPSAAAPAPSTNSSAPNNAAASSSQRPDGAASSSQAGGQSNEGDRQENAQADTPESSAGQRKRSFIEICLPDFAFRTRGW